MQQPKTCSQSKSVQIQQLKQLPNYDYIIHPIKATRNVHESAIRFVKKLKKQKQLHEGRIYTIKAQIQRQKALKQQIEQTNYLIQQEKFKFQKHASLLKRIQQISKRNAQRKRSIQKYHKIRSKTQSKSYQDQPSIQITSFISELRSKSKKIKGSKSAKQQMNDNANINVSLPKIDKVKFKSHRSIKGKRMSQPSVKSKNNFNYKSNSQQIERILNTQSQRNNLKVKFKDEGFQSFQ